jgi:hypothetical protein
MTGWLNVKMSREEAARFQYRLRPYLSGAPRPALDARLSDIAVNLFDLMPDGRIGLWVRGAKGRATASGAMEWARAQDRVRQIESGYR